MACKWLRGGGIVPKEIAFTIECSIRTAWEAIHTLLKCGPAQLPVYQGQYDPKT